MQSIKSGADHDWIVDVLVPGMQQTSGSGHSSALNTRVNNETQSHRGRLRCVALHNLGARLSSSCLRNVKRGYTRWPMPEISFRISMGKADVATLNGHIVLHAVATPCQYSGGEVNPHGYSSSAPLSSTAPASTVWIAGSITDLCVSPSCAASTPDEASSGDLLVTRNSFSVESLR